MDRAADAGVALTALGLVGYAGGMAAEYPGRAFSLTAAMVGITLLAVGLAGDGGQT